MCKGLFYTNPPLIAILIRVFVVEAIPAVQGVEAFGHAVERDGVADQVRKGVFVALENGKRAHKVFGRARPHGFKAQVAAHKHLIGICSQKIPHRQNAPWRRYVPLCRKNVTPSGMAGKNPAHSNTTSAPWPRGVFSRTILVRSSGIGYVGNVDGEIRAPGVRPIPTGLWARRP